MSCVYYWFQGRWCKANPRRSDEDIEDLRVLIERSGYVARLGSPAFPPIAFPDERELKLLSS